MARIAARPVGDGPATESPIRRLLCHRVPELSQRSIARCGDGLQPCRPRVHRLSGGQAKCMKDRANSIEPVVAQCAMAHILATNFRDTQRVGVELAEHPPDVGAVERHRYDGLAQSNCCRTASFRGGSPSMTTPAATVLCTRSVGGSGVMSICRSDVRQVSDSMGGSPSDPAKCYFVERFRGVRDCSWPLWPHRWRNRDNTAAQARTANQSLARLGL
jgi:hypothetical protein